MVREREKGGRGRGMERWGDRKWGGREAGREKERGW